MRASMPVRVAIFSLCALLGVALAACGTEIGDSCLTHSDCSPNGDRICDLSQLDGYCTVLGCDYDTCPSEAVCVRFFVGQFTNKTCDPVTEDFPSSDETDDCSLDEVCALSGLCVPRSAEVRYCMRKCDGDCRGGYECRDNELMIEHGGEPVLPPGERPDGDLQRFCAQAPL
jgi:hypothetical protein